MFARKTCSLKYLSHVSAVALCGGWKDTKYTKYHKEKYLGVWDKRYRGVKGKNYAKSGAFCACSPKGNCRDAACCVSFAVILIFLSPNK
jgi:hypothetical protein